MVFDNPNRNWYDDSRVILVLYHKIGSNIYDLLLEVFRNNQSGNYQKIP